MPFFSWFFEFDILYPSHIIKIGQFSSSGIFLNAPIVCSKLCVRRHNKKLWNLIFENYQNQENPNRFKPNKWVEGCDLTGLVVTTIERFGSNKGFIIYRWYIKLVNRKIKLYINDKKINSTFQFQNTCWTYFLFFKSHEF